MNTQEGAIISIYGVFGNPIGGDRLTEMDFTGTAIILGDEIIGSITDDVAEATIRGTIGPQTITFTKRYNSLSGWYPYALPNLTYRLSRNTANPVEEYTGVWESTKNGKTIEGGFAKMFIVRPLSPPGNPNLN